MARLELITMLEIFRSENGKDLRMLSRDHAGCKDWMINSCLISTRLEQLKDWVDVAGARVLTLQPWTEIREVVHHHHQHHQHHRHLQQAGSGSYCVAKSNADPTKLQAALDWACGPAPSGGNVDCSALQKGGSCANPNSIYNHASYAFDVYYSKQNGVSQACDFNGLATVSSTNPSSGTCVYPSTTSSSTSPSSSTGNSPPTDTTLSPPTDSTSNTTLSPPFSSSSPIVGSPTSSTTPNGATSLLKSKHIQAIMWTALFMFLLLLRH